MCVKTNPQHTSVGKQVILSMANTSFHKYSIINYRISLGQIATEQKFIKCLKLSIKQFRSIKPLNALDRVEL